ncbi:MAG: type III PLP-dependent enzyme [Chloroflexi bacterium]|nr:type III PLP-dependent enzyme [Chloroflexota bacterium]
MLTHAAPSIENLKHLFASVPETPALLIDRNVLREDFLAFKRSFTGSRICYAIKANSHPDVLSELHALGCDFEISSLGELRILQGIGVPGHRIITSNPIKSPLFIKEAYAAGIRHFVYDSKAEIDKLAELAPNSSPCVRLTVPNEGSEWPLDKKFGVGPELALQLLLLAKAKGLKTAGVTFHIGSQNRQLKGWPIALQVVRDLWDKAKKKGIRLTTLNVGGGMPVYYTNPEFPSVQEIAKTVYAARDALFPAGTETFLEPGRAMIARAGTIVTTVVGVADRDGTRWVYIDTGIFQGLAEALGGIKYRYLSEAPGPVEQCTLAGPSCDSMDTIARDVMLPQVKVGDRIAIPACGAYTTCYGTDFNGFPSPRTIIVG